MLLECKMGVLRDRWLLPSGAAGDERPIAASQPTVMDVDPELARRRIGNTVISSG